MDVKEYIASGVVELYAMNALSPDDKKEFERNLIAHPELSRELHHISNALEQFSHDLSINPRPQLRSRIVESSSNGKQNRNSAVAANTSIKNPAVLTYKYLIAASLAALVISTFASWFFYTRWSEAEDRYSNILTDKNELAESYNVVKRTYDENLAKLFVMRDPNTKMVELKSADPSANYLARVFWNTQSHRTYVDVLNLPKPEEGKQYQLWAITKEKPIDLGTCSVEEGGLQQLKDVENPVEWQISLEQKGNAAFPSPSVLSSH